MDAKSELVPASANTHEKSVGDLTKQVAIKLMQDSIKGLVGIFRDQKTGETEFEVYSMKLKSKKIPQLNVGIWRSFIPQKSAIPIDPSKLFISVHEWNPEKKGNAIGRKMTIKQRWEAPAEQYEIYFFKGESQLSPEATASFLNDILKTGFDQEKTEKEFGQPYRKGATKQHTNPDGTSFTQQWVRDLIEGEILPEGPLPEPKTLPATTAPK